MMPLQERDKREDQGASEIAELPFGERADEWYLDGIGNLTEAWQKVADVLRRDAPEVVSLELGRDEKGRQEGWMVPVEDRRSVAECGRRQRRD